MTDPGTGETTQLLHAAASGDKEAVDRLWSHVHGELRQMAAIKLRREKPGVTLEPTMVVSEVYIRMVAKDGTLPQWDNSPHFFGSVARAMNQFLIDRARRRDSLKRGGDRKRMPLEMSVGELASTGSFDDDRLAEVGEALGKLQEAFPRQADVAWLRWMQGFTIEETAAALEITPDRVSKDWKLAQAWLLREFSGDQKNDGIRVITSRVSE